jgi:uncharacterized protein YqjF (DUF2071 family)
VRLYSVDGQGRRGVVFRSLEASRLLPVLAARWVARLPYAWAGMRVTRDGDRLGYTSVRRWPGPRGAHSRIDVRVGDQLPPGDPLGMFLTARWGLHRPGRRGPVYWPNEHAEWPLHRAELLGLDESLLAAAGLPSVTGAPDSVLFSAGVAVRFGPPRSWRADI